MADHRGNLLMMHMFITFPAILPLHPVILASKAFIG